MQSALYVGLSGQVALKKRLDTIATNVANMNTAGYRAEEVKFETLLYSSGDKSVAYATSGDSYISRRIGGMTETGNPLDVAVQGNGWLAVQTKNGTAYTRDGRMRLLESGALETLAGAAVLDAGATPIVLDPNAGPPTIARDGMISQAGRQVGAIGLFSIDDQAKLQRAPDQGVLTDKPAAAVLDFTANGVAQGFVEGANVNPVMEMTRLITVQRAFDTLTAALESQESSLQDAIKSLGSAA